MLLSTLENVWTTTLHIPHQVSIPTLPHQSSHNPMSYPTAPVVPQEFPFLSYRTSRLTIPCPTLPHTLSHNPMSYPTAHVVPQEFPFLSYLTSHPARVPTSYPTLTSHPTSVNYLYSGYLGEICNPLYSGETHNHFYAREAVG